MHCLYATLLFGGAGALATPYVFVQILMVAARCSPQQTLSGIPDELSITK